MAKLCRFYVSGAGNESARFNPLIIDLRDRLEWKPQNTIIWLRNGGGKTTLISLFYSIFVPKISDFLGMRNNKGAKLQDFVRDDELAIIATEWQPSDLAAPRRTVGTVILKTSRDLKRFFFSFNETKTTSFSFDTLPARGLSEPAGSYDAFRERLIEAMRVHPSIELVLTEIQSSWIQHLDSIGLDTELFRTHLIMNSQEGGAADIFKIKSSEDFVKRFLELAYDESSTEEIEKSLQAFKEKRESAPHYAKSIEFGETLIRLLTPFSADVAKRKQARISQGDLDREAGQARCSVHARRTILESEIANLAKEIENYTNRIDDLGRELRRLNSFARNYKSLGKRLKVDETKKAYEIAAAAEAEANQELEILKAAKEFATVRSIENEHAALVRERDKLREDLRPQLNELRVLGARLKAAWCRRVADLAAAHELTKELAQTAQSKIVALTDKKAELSGSITGAEKDKESAQKAIRSYEEAHRRLRESTAIREDEKAGDALSRLKSEIWTIGNSIDALKVGAGVLASRLKVQQSALVALNRSASDAQAAAERAESKLLDEEERRMRIERLPVIAEIVVGGQVQLSNPYLQNRLDEIAEDAQSKLIQIGVLGADDLRDDVSMDKFGLFAPSADVEALTSLLATKGIKTAIPAYHWLAEHCSAQKAAMLCETNPAVCSGILIQDPKEFERARQEIRKAPIRTPIVLFLSSPSQAAPLPSDFVVVGPEETGMYSKEEASRALPALAGRREERSGKQAELESRRSSAQSASTRIKEHLRTFPEERLREWKDALTDARKRSLEFDRDIENAAAEIAKTEADLAENTRQSEEHIKTKGTLIGQENEVSNFIREHEQSIGEHRTRFNDASTQIISLGRELEDNKISTAELREAATKLEVTSRDQEFRWREAGKAHVAIPAEFVGEDAPTGMNVGRPEDLAPEFEVAVASYNGLLNASGLDGRITAKSEDLVKARGCLARAVAKIPVSLASTRVQDASQAADIDGEIIEQENAYRVAGQAKAVAKSHYDNAANESPTDSDFKAGSLIDNTRSVQPTTSWACQEVAAEYETEAATVSAHIEETKETKGIASGSKSKKETEQAEYKGLFNSLPEVPETFEPHPEFSAIVEQDTVLIEGLVHRIDRNWKDLSRAEASIDNRYSNQILPHIQSPDYDPFRIEFRERLKYLHKEDIASKVEDLIEDIQTAVAACRNDLEHEDQHRRIIVEQLDDIVQRTTRLLSQASEVSKMPPESGAWAHQPFLRISVPKKSDKTERAVLLQGAMQGWYDTNSIPHGYLLAHHCLLAVCGTKTIAIKMLKPEYIATSTPHDILDLMKFSDGEKLTAAILLYCVLVRLRARQRAKQFHFGTSDSGLLLLDNPIGKATLNEFVELQVRVARLMGVQLVYATGIGAESALKHFPHIVRLKNSVRSRSNNDHYVTLDDGDHVVDGITLGVGDHVTRRN